MSGPVARIIIRYGVGALVMKGILAPELGTEILNDPDVAQLTQVSVGIVAGVATETFYYFAKKYGWNL